MNGATRQLPRPPTSNPQKYCPHEERVPMYFPPTPAGITRGRIDGTDSFGPYGIYGSRIPRTPVLDLLRNAVKPGRLARVEEVLLQRTTRVTMLLENLVDPANASACIRTCEGLGLTDMHVVESYEPFRTTQGITMNADKWVEVHSVRHYADAVDRLKGEGFTLVATCLDKDALPIDEVDFESMDKICIMLGNEQRGLSAMLREAADVKAIIPMVGMSQSLNIATSCGVFLQTLRSRGICKPNLSDERIARLYQKWLITSTKNAATLLEKHGFQAEVAEYM